MSMCLKQEQKEGYEGACPAPDSTIKRNQVFVSFQIEGGLAWNSMHFWGPTTEF